MLDSSHTRKLLGMQSSPAAAVTNWAQSGQLQGWRGSQLQAGQPCSEALDCMYAVYSLATVLHRCCCCWGPCYAVAQLLLLAPMLLVEPELCCGSPSSGSPWEAIQDEATLTSSSTLLQPVMQHLQDRHNTQQKLSAA